MRRHHASATKGQTRDQGDDKGMRPTAEHQLYCTTSAYRVRCLGPVIRASCRRPLEALLDGGAEAARSEAEEAATERDELLLD